MLLLFTGLDKGVDNISQHMQRFVDITSFFEPVSFHFCQLGPFRSSQIHNVDFRPADLQGIALFQLGFDVNGEDSVRT